MNQSVSTAAPPQPDSTSWRVRALALVIGVVNHSLFLFAIGSMAIALWTGMNLGIGRLEGTAALVANLLLLLQFPLIHSALLSKRGSRLLVNLFPAPHGRTLITTTYAISASLQLTATFWLWSPSGVTVWQPQGLALGVHVALFAASWLFLIKAIHDSGVAVQSGLLGWWALFRGRAPQYPTFATRGTFAICRQPIYLAFALLLWTAPGWTLDRLLLAAGWTAYCVIGPLLKERRYVARHGDAYRAYQSRVSYFLPLAATTLKPHHQISAPRDNSRVLPPNRPITLP